MRRLALTFALALLPSMAGAQPVSGGFNTRMTVQANCAAATCNAQSPTWCVDSPYSRIGYVCDTVSGTYRAVASTRLGPADSLLSAWPGAAWAGGTTSFEDIAVDLTLADPAVAPTLGSTFTLAGACRADTTYRFTVVWFNASGNSAASPTLQWQPSSGNTNRATVNQVAPPAGFGVTAWTVMEQRSSEGYGTFRYYASGVTPIAPIATTSVIATCQGTSTFTNTNTTGLSKVMEFFDSQIRGPARLGADPDDPRLTNSARRLTFAGTFPTWSTDGGVTTLPFNIVSGKVKRVCPVCEYTTGSAAMAAITDASATNRYVVLFEPGDYQEQINMKPWTSLVGRGPASRVLSIIRPTGCGEVAVMNLQVAGTPSLSGAGTPGACRMFLIGNIFGDIWNPIGGAPANTTIDTVTGPATETWDVGNIHVTAWDAILLGSEGAVTYNMSGSQMYLDPTGININRLAALRVRDGCTLRANGIYVYATIPEATDNVQPVSIIHTETQGSAPSTGTNISVTNSLFVINGADTGRTAITACVLDDDSAHVSAPSHSLDLTGTTCIISSASASGTVAGMALTADEADTDKDNWRWSWASGRLALSGGANRYTLSSADNGAMTFELGPGLSHAGLYNLTAAGQLTYARSYLRSVDLAVGTCSLNEEAIDTGGATREWCYCRAANTWDCLDLTGTHVFTANGPKD